MPEQPSDQPLRGEAAWRAARSDIATRNAAAQKVGAAERAAREAVQADGRRASMRAEEASRPKPPPG